MTRFTKLAGTTALTTLMAAPAAHADVTADDVWANYKDYVNAFGGTYSATAARNGDRLEIAPQDWTFDLPMDLGTVALSLPAFSLNEKGDGTVALVYPEEFTLGLNVDLTEEDDFYGELIMTMSGFEMTASGAPNDVTYVYSSDEMTLALGKVEFEEMENSEIELTGLFSDLNGTSRVTVGNQITATTQTQMGAHSFKMRAVDDEGVEFLYDGSGDTLTSDADLTLPRGGLDILNLAAALNSGLSLKGTSAVTGYTNTQITNIDGELFSEQTNTAATYTTAIALDRDGVKVDGAASDMTGRLLMQEIFPAPIDFAATSGKFDMTLPVSAADELQDAGVVMSMQGMTINEDIWAMFDPAQALPRDPMAISMDIDAKVKSFVDWLNFAKLQELEGSGEMPGEIHALTLNDLTIDMVGAKLNGTGALTFDNSGSIPKPVGAIDLSLIGANALMDKLVTMGMMSEDDVMGTRMMMGAFAAPDPANGEDALKSRIEFNEQGHILANGQRIQ
ncbi:DUF2125 domain-containing protein [Arenibacterium sp. CAU 1754]